MSQSNASRPVCRPRILSALFLTLVFSAASLPQGLAQTPHAVPAPVSESLKHAHTPKEVLDGTAKPVGHLASTTLLHLAFGLTPPRMAEEEKFLHDLQDKKSPSFHKYLSADQWNTRFAPSVEDEQAVVDWAENNHLTVTKRYANRLLVTVDGTAENVEKAFAVTMNSYELAGNQEFSNDRDPVIPAHLAGILHSVSGLNSIQRLHASGGGYPDPKGATYATPAELAATAPVNVHADGSKAALTAAMKAAEEARNTAKTLKGITPEAGTLSGIQPDITSGYIDPTDIYSSYGYDFGALQAQGHCCNPTNDGGGSTPTTSIAIATAGALNYSDLAGFHSRYSYLAYSVNSPTVGGTYTCNNSPNNDKACVETTLDTEWALATANSFGSYLSTSHVWVYLAVDSKLSTFSTMFNDILSDGHARVMSTSWSCGEFDCYDSATMDTDHGIFNSMLGQGWTLLGDSDDHGAAKDCGTALGVEYPASDPDLIAVGGTSLALFTDGTFFSETGWQGGTGSGSCAANSGGSGGGCSAKFAAPAYQASPFCGSGSRSVPDIALNAGYGQNIYYNGGWTASGGTSIATPMVAGFIAQEDSYLLALGLGGTPAGEVDYQIYYEANHPSYAEHFPYYDMTSGCNNNDITAANNTGYYCALSGYDAVTGWGSFNALQLAWAINTYDLGDFAGPTVTFSGPPVSPTYYTYYNTDQTVSWTVTDTGSGLAPTGVAGFSQAWDGSFSDPVSEATEGTGNSFYSGPQFPNATSGFLKLSWAGEGCHYATVDAWDNSGFTNGNQYYYWICYDITAPVTSAGLSGYLASGIYANPVTVTLNATDNLSGVVSTAYKVDGGSLVAYSGPFTISSNGNHTVSFYSTDKAGNVESTKAVSFREEYSTSTKVITTEATAPQGTAVTFTATVTSSGTAPTGSVQFLDGSTVLGTGTLSSGKAAYTTSTLAQGLHSISAAYQSDTTHYYSTSGAINELIKYATTTSIITSEATAPTGIPVTFTATVASTGTAPTGTVTFKDGTTTIGTGTISAGKATYTTSTLAEGMHSISAYYSNDSTHFKSNSGAINELIKYATTTTVGTSNATVPQGTAVTFTAKVTSSGTTPTGSVIFKDGTTTIGTATLSSGAASFTTSSLAPGTHSITANYGNDSTHFKSSSGPLTELIKYTTTTTVTTSNATVTQGTTVTFTATVSSSGPTPTGMVAFKDGTTTIGTGTLAAGVTTFKTSALAVGTHSITAYYENDSTHYHSTSAAISEVVKVPESGYLIKVKAPLPPGSAPLRVSASFGEDTASNQCSDRTSGQEEYAG